MNQSDDQNNSGLRVSGYGPRIKQTLIVVVVLAVIVAAIVLAAIWANNREPDPGVQPTPRSTQAPLPTATSPPPDTPTTEPTETTEVQVADTPTTPPTEAPPEDTPTPDVETPEPDTPTPTVAATETPPTETPKIESQPTPEPTEQPTVAPTDTPAPPTHTSNPEPQATATNTPKPEPTSTPTITPTPLPTATPTITPTPTPEVPTLLEIYARGDLIDQGIDQSDIQILSVVEHTWPDLTLGCGPISYDNPARPVEGWILVLGNDEKTYTFHVASKDQGEAEDLNLKAGEPGIVVNCTDVGPTEQLTVNLVHDLRLHEARRVILYRGLGECEQQPIEDINDRALIQEIVDALNTPIPIGNTDSCQTAFRLDFYVLRGIETIRFFCDKDWFRVEGEQEVWDGTQGALPQELLNSVAKYLANQSLPQIPSVTPTPEC